MKNSEDIKILIVEDEEDQRMRLKYVLETDGYKIFEAPSGDKAIELLTTKSNYYDLVITDLKMPGKNNGLDVLREAKKTSETTDVIIVTAYGTIDNAVQAIINGAFDYIQKPINMPELRIKIERALKNKAILNKLNAKEILINNVEALSKKLDTQNKQLLEILKLSQLLLQKIKPGDPGYDLVQEITKLSELK